jgi:hypothetical protein
VKKLGKIHTWYKIYNEYLKNPRVKILALHNDVSPYKSKDSTYKLIEEAFKNGVIIGPFIYCNTGFSVKISKENKNPLKIIQNLEKNVDSRVTHAITLSGDYNFLKILCGGNQLVYSESTRPSCPASLKVEEFSFLGAEGRLGIDNPPDNWDDVDWSVYNAMRRPTVSFFEIGKKLGLSWMTVKRHYEKIIEDCKVLISFFPRGYNGYDRILLTFGTKYEIELKRALERLDRSSYLWKYDNTIILTLFIDKYNETTDRFYELEENGLIQNLKVSIPIRYYEPHISLGMENQARRHHRV